MVKHGEEQLKILKNYEYILPIDGEWKSNNGTYKTLLTTQLRCCETDEDKQSQLNVGVRMKHPPGQAVKEAKIVAENPRDLGVVGHY